MRPLRPGLSIGSTAVGVAGTICCFVRNTEGRRFVLTSDDVIFGSPGTHVLQPGPMDGGSPEDRIGSVAKAIPATPGRSRTSAGFPAPTLPCSGHVGLKHLRLFTRLGPCRRSMSCEIGLKL